MPIRPCLPGEGAALADLMRRSVAGLGGRHYAPAQVRAWASLLPPAEAVERSLGDGRIVLVALAGDGRPLAFGDLEADGHIDRLFAAPEAAGTGVAAALIGALETCARRQGLSRLYVEASEAARGAFLRHGFRVVRRRENVVAGVLIHNYEMQKGLPPAPPTPSGGHPAGVTPAEAG